MTNNNHEKKWFENKTSRMIFIFDSVLFIAIVISVLFYDFGRQYFDHSTTIYIGIVAGLMVGLIPVLALHKLMSRRDSMNGNRNGLVEWSTR